MLSNILLIWKLVMTIIMLFTSAFMFRAGGYCLFFGVLAIGNAILIFTDIFPDENQHNGDYV